MSRKAKEFKGLILRIEGLSEPGRVDTPQPAVEYDDFTGEVISQIILKPVLGIIAADHRELKRREDRQAALLGLSMLVRLGLGQGRADPIPREVVPKGWHKIAEINGKAMMVPMKPWRRI